MALPSCCRRALRRILPLIVVLVSVQATDAGAVVRPLEGVGNFHTYVDVINRWQDEGHLNVMVLVEVANADISYEEETNGLVGRLRVEVELESLDGEKVDRKLPVRTMPMTVAQTSSRTEFQLFGVVLDDVPFRMGRVRCSVFDTRGRKAGILNQMRKQLRRSDSSGAWAAPEAPRPPQGIALEDPLFLAHAPLASWRPGVEGAAGGLLHDYIHPSRRYGLEQDHLQLFVPLWPQAGGIPLDAPDQGLRVQVTSLEMDFAFLDTINFDNVGRGAMAAGQPAGLVYELDVNLLPEGSYLLNIAPLDRRGQGIVRQFDVIWRLAALARNPHQLEGEGRTVFHGDELKTFLAASPAEREALLATHWESVNPDPESPLNAAYLEFQYRLAFVRQFLGGFGRFGAEDQRGEVFMALGMPDEVRAERMPMNFRDQDDARIQVFERFSPDREGSTAKGGGSIDRSPYNPNATIPVPWSHRAEKERVVSETSATHLHAFELWKYERGGNPLWESRFSSTGMGQRFLFVDRTGSGEYFLESSNIVQGEE